MLWLRNHGQWANQLHVSSIVLGVSKKGLDGVSMTPYPKPPVRNSWSSFT